MRRRNIIILVIMLLVGFASVTTTLILNGVIGISANTNDFSVTFTEAKIDGEGSTVEIDETKRKITFTTNTLTNIGAEAILTYKIKNNSTQYNANIEINCSHEDTDYITINSELAGEEIIKGYTTIINAQEIKSGSITSKLKKSYTGENTSINITCEIIAEANERESYAYTLNFENEGEIISTNKIVNTGDNYGDLPILEKENYVFLGWYTEDDEKVTADSIVNIDKNTTLYAKWALECPLEIGTSWTFDYKESEEIFSVPCDAEYKLETWGAEGGSATTTYIGGYGGYSKGNITLAYNEDLYINVGGAGLSFGKKIDLKGGYNGGGFVTHDNVNHEYGSGGGATHIAKASGLLASLSEQRENILIVSGGGGGGRWQSNYDDGLFGNGGHGGGFHGGYGSSKDVLNAIGGGSQTGSLSGGIKGSFGKGADAKAQAGGGGGFYGGNTSSSAGGGSGYIGNNLLTNKEMYCYNCTESSEASTKTTSTVNVSSDPIENYAKKGNGYAKITLVSLPY